MRAKNMIIRLDETSFPVILDRRREKLALAHTNFTNETNG